MEKVESNLPEELKEKYEELKEAYFDNVLFDDPSIYEGIYYEVQGTSLVAIAYTQEVIKDGELNIPMIFDGVDFKKEINEPDALNDGLGVIKVNLGRVITIPEKCFQGWNQLLEVVGNSAIVVNPWAFSDCLSLRSVVLPNLAVIAQGGFAKCNNVLELSFPKLRILDEGAFNECINLVKLDIHNVKSVSEGVCAKCEKLEEIDMSSCVTLGSEALALCTSLKKLNLRLCRVFEKGALRGCASLEVLYLDNIMGMHEESLSMCDNLSVINYYGTKERWEQLVVESNVEVDILRKVQMVYNYKDE